MREVVAAVDVGGTRIKAALVDRSYDVVAAAAPCRRPADIARRHRRRPSPRRWPTCSPPAERDGAPRRGWSAAAWSCPAWSTSGAAWACVGQPGLARPAGPRRGGRARCRCRPPSGTTCGPGCWPRPGSARRAGRRHALFLPVGTGIAGALMLEGRADLGRRLGRRARPHGRRPGRAAVRLRRRVGCLETIASAAAVERGVRRATGERLLGRAGRRADAVGRRPGGGAVWERAVSRLGAGDRRDRDAHRGGPRARRRRAGRERGDAAGAPLRADLDARLTFQRPPAHARRAALGDRAGCLGRRRAWRGTPCDPHRHAQRRPRRHLRRRRAGAARAATASRAVRQRAGGKGVNVASVLARMGHAGRRHRAAPGAGPARTSRADLDARGIAHRFVDGAASAPYGHGRLGGARRRHGLQRAGPGGPGRTGGPRWCAASASSCASTAPAWSCSRAACPAVCRRTRTRGWSRAARAHGARAVVDADGAALRDARHGRRPRSSSPTAHELLSATGCTDDRRRRGGAAVPPAPATWSCRTAPRGSCCSRCGGRRLRARLPEPLAGNPTGAGDALVAALAAGLEDGDAVAGDGSRGRWPGPAAAVLQPVAGEIDPD